MVKAERGDGGDGLECRYEEVGDLLDVLLQQQLQGAELISSEAGDLEKRGDVHYIHIYTFRASSRRFYPKLLTSKLLNYY